MRLGKQSGRAGQSSAHRSRCVREGPHLHVPGEGGSLESAVNVSMSISQLDSFEGDQGLFMIDLAPFVSRGCCPPGVRNPIFKTSLILLTPHGGRRQMGPKKQERSERQKTSRILPAPLRPQSPAPPAPGSQWCNLLKKPHSSGQKYHPLAQKKAKRNRNLSPHFPIETFGNRRALLRLPSQGPQDAPT